MDTSQIDSPMTATVANPDLIADFVDEALESLRQLPVQLDAYRAAPQVAEPIHAVFRAVHSIKGCSGFLGLNGIKAFAHGLENAMDEVRKEQAELTADLQRALVQGFDLLDELLQQALAGQIDDEIQPREAELLVQIRTLVDASRIESTPEHALLAELERLASEMSAALSPEAAGWRKRLQSAIGEFAGQETAGEEGAASTDATPAMPTAAELSSATFRVGDADATSQVRTLLEMFLAFDRKEYNDAVGEAFVAAAETFAAWAEPLGEAELAKTVAAAGKDFRTLLNSPLDIDGMLLSIIWDKLAPALAKCRVTTIVPAAATPSSSPASTVAADTADAKDKDKKPAAAKARMLRIKEERIDEFLDDVSRLFITGELLKDLQNRMGETRQLASLVEELKSINQAFIVQSTKLQRSVVALRRVAISGLFSKFPQMARSLGQQLGKKIDVEISGEETEVDKSLVEDLDAPLAHMIRNVADHGIEMPEDRIARGKPANGTLWLKGEATRSHVVVTVRDDGRGIDPRILRAKAVEKGIYTQAQADALTDQQAIELIFHAGFSTAKQVSDVSGRGVGMDVVRTTLRDHNGEVYVDSQVGSGTTFRLEIPIREAVVVIDGLMVRQNEENFVLPFSHVREIAEVGPDELKPVQGAQVAILRDRTYDAVALASLLKLAPQRRHPRSDGKLFAIHVGAKHGDLCLLVDHITGHRQVVVNKFEDLGAGNEKIAGVAQLGGGRLAMVLSIPDIVQGLLSGKA